VPLFDEWKNLGDWLGTGTVAAKDRIYLPFDEARRFVRSLKLRGHTEWNRWGKKKRPQDIPSAPNVVYKDEWQGWGDWLGTKNIRHHWLSFDEARETVRSLGLKTQKEWVRWSKSDKRPENIPAYPIDVYKNEWKGVGDWLGTGRIANFNCAELLYWSFTEAREFVHRLQLKNTADWKRYLKSGKRPIKLPTNPNATYKRDWQNWADWLGSTKCRRFGLWRSFDAARTFVRQLKLQSFEEWRGWNKSGKRPQDIPTHPDRAYKEDWESWKDWLGVK
jgi:hypothetical protein